MALTTEQLEAQRDALITRMASGVKNTQFGERSVTNADIEQMEKALAILDGQIAVSTGTRNSRCLLIQHSNG